MTNQELGSLVIAAAVLAVYGCVIAWRRWRSRDEIFVGVTPGLMPAPGQPAERAKVRGREYSGDIAVQFHPPQGLRPGLVGTVVDGTADMRDVTATIIDLAVRGYCRIEPVEEQNKDWEISQIPPTREMVDELDPTERMLLQALFMNGPVTRMSALTAGTGQALREAQQNLYQRTVDYGWYPQHPKKGTQVGCLGVLAAIVVIGWAAVTALNGITGPQVLVGNLVAAALMVFAPVLLYVLGRSRVGRTAEGCAVRIQALGFKKYLATAEADQIKVEEAAGVFSRYLPYAIVFGVADHWAKVFGEVAAKARLEGVAVTMGDLAWFGLDVATDLAYLNLLSGGELIGDLVGLVDLADFASLAAGIGEGAAGFAQGVGDFVGSVDGLSALGDGCDGCDILDIFDF